MPELDYLTVLLPVILSAVLSAVIGLIFMAVTRMGKNTEGTLSGSIRLENVRTNLDGLDGKMEKGFDKITDMLESQEKETRMAFDKVWTRFEDINSEIKLHEYRLNEFDRRRYKNGAVDNGNGNHNSNGGNK
jgi:hypothetical protein